MRPRRCNKWRWQRQPRPWVGPELGPACSASSCWEKCWLLMLILIEMLMLMRKIRTNIGLLLIEMLMLMVNNCKKMIFNRWRWEQISTTCPLAGSSIFRRWGTNKPAVSFEAETSQNGAIPHVQKQIRKEFTTLPSLQAGSSGWQAPVGK